MALAAISLHASEPIDARPTAKDWADLAKLPDWGATWIPKSSDQSAQVTHHSGAMFDGSKRMTINGAVKEVRWVNPHVTLTILGTVKDGQEPTPYLLEMTSPSMLSRLGWTKSTFKPGDQVKAEFSPLFDAEQHGGSLKSIISIETGKTFVPNLIEQENLDNN